MFFSVFVAAHKLDDNLDWFGQIRMPISAYIKSPKFTYRVHDGVLFNDIALVKLEYPVNSSATHNPVGPWGTICLPKQDSTYNGHLGNLTSVAGWGWTRPGDSGSGSNVLRKLENLPVVSTDWCREKYSIDDYDQANSVVCTYSEGRDTCTVSELKKALSLIRSKPSLSFCLGDNTKPLERRWRAADGQGKWSLDGGGHHQLWLGLRKEELARRVGSCVAVR